MVEQTSQTVASGLWGLDRVDQVLLPLSATYSHGGTGARVTAYVIDTCIATAHPDFKGRAANVFDAFGGSGEDCNGHGTHVARTIGGETHGVAKDVAWPGSACWTATAWAPIPASSPGSTGSPRTPLDRPVGNLSLGGNYSSALKTAVSALSGGGVTVVVAAGNDNVRASTTSPTSTPAALTVAASDRRDYKPSFSNHGTSVDLYAPGLGITSSWLNGATASLNGASMAAPHVTGVAVLCKGDMAI